MVADLADYAFIAPKPVSVLAAALGGCRAWVPENPEPRPFQVQAEVMHAGGTRLRLRSLVAMGFCEGRIAKALGETRARVTLIVNGNDREVRTELARDAVRLWEAWWDKLPPTVTRTDQRAFTRARRKAFRENWCCPLGLDEEYVDVPGYLPDTPWRPALGLGVADPYPLGLRAVAA